ncbi:hypothetical protein DYB36_001083 [Aphanomyces astaci]|uniref:Uncharacterized protein n=1 Tax=Aphanomyces astaci TaxID=112090 RepID=A0A397ALJ3_APHAT|nr:hypothetical protein DYB36_001083 [Aphanomyces astaci]
MSTLQSLDLIERFSQSDDKLYDGFKTPDTIEAGGALRAGPPPSYSSLDVLALMSQYASMGLLYGVTYNLSYPFLTVYFHMEGTQLTSANALMTLAWSFKVFIGMLSDCVPVFGLRRKPYMFVGWTINAICMLVLASVDHGLPLYIDPSLEGRPLSNLTADESRGVDPTAPSRGAFMVIMCTIAAFGQVVAEAACDALVVEYAQREPLHCRGRMQSLTYAIRLCAQGVTGLMFGFCNNSPRFGGTYSWDIGVNGMFILVSITSTLAVPVTIFGVKEAKRTEAVSFQTYLGQCWALAQKRAVWQIVLYLFWSTVFYCSITTTASPYVKFYWAKVESFNSALIMTISNCVSAGVLMLMASYGLHWNWRVTFIVTTLIANGLDAIVQYCTIFDVFRNQWVYLGMPLAEQVPLAINWAVTMYVIVELAEDGSEGVMYGLLTTVMAMPMILGAMVTNIYCAELQLKSTDIASDTSDVRRDVAYSYMVKYGAAAFSCCWVVLFPRQKAECAELKKNGGNYPRVGAAVLISCFVILCVSVTSTVMSMFDATACYVFAGGQGCDLVETSG